MPLVKLQRNHAPLNAGETGWYDDDVAAGLVRKGWGILAEPPAELATGDGPKTAVSAVEGAMAAKAKELQDILPEEGVAAQYLKPADVHEKAAEIQKHADKLLTEAEDEAKNGGKKAPRDIGAEALEGVKEVKAGGGKRVEVDEPEDEDDPPKRGPGRPRKVSS